MPKTVLFAVFLVAVTSCFQSTSYSQSSSLPASDVQLAEAIKLYRLGDFSQAHKLLNSYIDHRLTSPEWKIVPVDDSWVEALRTFTECCLELEDYQKAIEIYDLLERLDAGNAQVASNRGMCYQELEQWIPALDNYRLAHSREPNELLYRLILAKALVTAPHASLRDAKEAASLLQGLQQQLPMNAATLEIQAAIAAEEGDFVRAVKLQSQVIALEKDNDTKKQASGIRDLYKRQTRYPFFAQEPEPLNELERTQAISAGTVIVRVRGRASYDLDNYSGSAPRVIENQHAGIVLNDRGHFMIASSSLAIPYTAEPTWKTVDGASWIEGPFIEVYLSTPSPEGIVTLGRAEVKGVDEATGLALIRLYDYPTSEVRRKLVPLRLQPAYRALGDQPIADMMTMRLRVWSPRQPVNFLVPISEDQPFGEICFRPVLEKVSVQFNQSLTTLNRWNAPESKRVGTWSKLEASELTVGAPIIDAAGECVAMVDEVRTEDGLVKSGIPAEVISRVSARLLSFGKADQPY